MSPDSNEEQKKPQPRDLRNIGNELASLASGLSQSLQSDWVRATAEAAPAPKVTERSTAVCIQYGQRLGELGLATERAETLIESEIESLHEASVRDFHSRLARLGSRATFLLSTQLPALMEHRRSLSELLTGISVRWQALLGDRPFRWHTFLFYLIPAVLVLGAEGALAEDITRSAFRLKGILWFLFPVALLSLPLVFKEFLQWQKLDRLQKGYIAAILLLMFALLLPLSWTRSNEVFRGTARAGQSARIDPFASPAPGGAPPAAAPIRLGSQGKIILLTSVFAMFGALFPMISGLCFHRAWDIADKGLEGRRVRQEKDKTIEDLEAVDTQIGVCRTELDTIRHETVQLITSLGPGDRFVERMISDMVGSLRGAGAEVVASVKQKAEGARGEGGWPELAKRLALEVEALELPSGTLHQIQVKFQKDLLSDIAQIDKGNSLENFAMTFKKKLRAALSEGHQIGLEAPFAVMAAHSPEDMVRLVRQRKLRDVLFRDKRSAIPNAAPV